MPTTTTKPSVTIRLHVDGGNENQTPVSSVRMTVTFADDSAAALARLDAHQVLNLLAEGMRSMGLGLVIKEGVVNYKR